MIGRLKGSILEKKSPLVLIETGGVGYEVCMPTICFDELPDLGQESIIFTHLLVKKNTHILYGFSNKQKQTLFRELIKTNKMGEKLAITILSNISFKQFICAIQQEDLAELIKIPGIGEKTAKRLINEMKGRINYLRDDLFTFKPDSSPIISMKSSCEETAQKEAIAALVALGYKPKNASRMISQIATPADSRNTLIRKALRATL